MRSLIEARAVLEAEPRALASEQTPARRVSRLAESERGQ